MAKQPSKFNSKELMKQQRQVSSYKKLNELRKNAALCNVIIKSADGDSIHIHKCVLMSNCMYFEKLFNEKLNGNDQNLTHTLDINSDILYILIEYIYTGTLIHIHMENVERIIKGADILQLLDVQDLCIEFLVKSINGENWLKIKAIADSSMIANVFNVSDKCFSWALEHFDEIIMYTTFWTIEIEQLQQLIESDEIYTVLEDNVYDAVITWIKHDERNRKHFLPELITLVRVSLMDNMYVHKILNEEPLITSNCICLEYLTKIHKDLFYKRDEICNYDIQRHNLQRTCHYANSRPCLRCTAIENGNVVNDLC